MRPDAHFLWLNRRMLAMVMEIEWLVLAMGIFFVFPMMLRGRLDGVCSRRAMDSAVGDVWRPLRTRTILTPPAALHTLRVEG
jgi:hypothetical protein